MTSRFSDLLTWKTLRQLVAYGIVGGLEYAAGLLVLAFIASHHVNYLLAFTAEQGLIGFAAFFVRKYAIFWERARA